MSNLIQQFNGVEIKIVIVNLQRLVCAKDVLMAIGHTYDSARMSWNKLRPKLERIVGGVHTEDVYYPQNKRTFPTDFINQDALNYLLIDSDKPNTDEFKRWALKVISREQQQQFNTLSGSEEEISNALSLLASRSRNNLVFEQSEASEELYGTDRFGLPRCKRYDIVQNLGKLYRIYEIKKGSLTSLEVFNTVQKDYLELASIVNPGKKLELIMIADGIDQGAQDYLDRLDAQTEYKEFRIKDLTYEAKVRYMHVNDFAMELYNKAARKTPQGGLWALQQFAVRYCHPVFNDLQLKQLGKGIYGAKQPVYYMESAA